MVNLYEAIETRRTIKQYTETPVEREVIERLLNAAVWAPNHYSTEPWRFSVLTGDARDGLAALRRQQVGARLGETVSPQAVSQMDDAYARMAGAAALIVVRCMDGATSERTEENRFATAAATQNLLLAATAEGLGSFWSTSICRYPPAHRYLGLADDEFMMAVVHLGYAAREGTGRRKPAAALTRWWHRQPVCVST